MPRALFVGLVVVLGAVEAMGASSQFPSGLPPDPPGEKLANTSFEVASIKENPATWREAGGPSTRMAPSGQFTAIRETVRRLIMSAYDVRDYQIVDAPKWIADTRFDIMAKAPDGFVMGQTRAMMRRLLADRFALVVRQEKRAMATYSLEWVDSRRTLGSGIRPSSAGQCIAPPSDVSSPGSLALITGGSARGVQGSAEQTGKAPCPVVSGWRGDFLYIRQSPLASMVTLLTSGAGRPVIDKTGLTGEYDADIRVPGIIPGRPQMPDDRDPDSGGVSIFTAVREQLGLKLTAKKGDVEVFAIARVERPKPN